MRIPLTQGKFALIDDADHPKVGGRKWFYHKTGYARRNYWVNGKCKTELMHRTILDAPNDMEVDHINGNGLDNRRSNLRICTHAQNIHNSDNSSNTSGYKGVGKHLGRWAAYICFQGRQTTIGRFGTPEQAALAYNNKAKELFGEFAKLNKIPSDKSSNPYLSPKVPRRCRRC